MKTIRIEREIDCGEKHCDKCSWQSDQFDDCTVFFDDTGDLIELEFDRKQDDCLRCQECLDSEVK
jgi:hypothetical protein